MNLNVNKLNEENAETFFKPESGIIPNIHFKHFFENILNTIL